MRRIVWLLALASLGCQAAEAEIVEIRGRTMGTTYQVKFVGFRDASASVRGAVEQVLASVNRTFSTYDPESVVSRFNRSRELEPFAVGEDFCDLLRMAIDVARVTEGAFDPTVLPLARLYPFPGRAAKERPSDAALKEALAFVGFEKLEVLESAVRKTLSAVEVDPNAFAKGHGVDRVAAEVARLGYAHFMVEIGGEVRCRGAKPDGKAWRIGIESPGAAPGTALAETVELRDSSLATSGSYRQFFESDGERVHHILDPRTGVNAPGPVVSVSVLATDCAFADALATALMVTGPDGIEPLRAAFSDRKFRVLFLLRGEGTEVERREFDWP